MPQSRATSRAPNFESPQRQRVLAGMLAAINEDGYTGATVANVIARAGISRATFYDCFRDKDDCFVALYGDISTHLLDQLAHTVNASEPEQALQVIVRQLADHAEAEPAQAQFLASSALTGEPRALDERGHTIDQISNIVQAAHALASPKAQSPDLLPKAVIGATYWLISQRIRRGEQNFTQLTQQLTHWLRRYEQPIGNHRWAALNPGPPSAPHPRLPEPSDDMPPPCGLTKRSNRAPGEAAQSQRRRILLATAESALQTGYAASTVTAITTDARLRKGVFYRHFRDKRQAFLALHDIAFQQCMGVGAAAYFSAQHWPECVWRCLLATSQFLAEHPSLAQVGFVETHALGPPAIQRVENSRQAFTTLLRGDWNTSPLPSVTTTEAIGAAIFEIAHDQVRRRRATDLPRYAYHATYLALAPFVGVPAANRFVERKLNDAKKHQRPAKRRGGG